MELRMVWTFVFFLCWCLSSAGDSYDLFVENGKMGLKDERGHVIIPAKYEALGWSDGSISVVNNLTGYKNNGLWGLINLEGEHITSPVYFGLITAEGNLFIAVKQSNLSLRLVKGCIDSSGKEIIPFIYDGISIHDFRAIVSVKSRDQYEYGLLDMSGKPVIAANFKQIECIGPLRYAVKNTENKHALFSENGKQLTAFVFDRIYPFKKNYAVIVREGKQGIIDREGVIKAEPEYASILINDEGTAAKAKPFNEWTILDGENKVLHAIEADSIISLDHNLFKLRKGESVQLVNGTFHPVNGVLLSNMNPFINNKSVFTLGNKKGVISTGGSIVVPPHYDRVELEKDYIIAAKENQWSLLDSMGNVKTSKKYQHIEYLNSIVFLVKNHNYFGAIDKNGKEVISCVFDSIQHAGDELFVVKFHGAYGIIDIHEKWRVSPQPHPLKLISNDRYLLYKDGMVFLKSTDGKIIYFTENPVKAEQGNLIEYVSTGGTWKIDLNGRIIDRQLFPEEVYEKILPESEGLIGIKKDGRYGFIDVQGRLRIANRYEGIKGFHNTMAAVKLLNKWGFVNHEEKLVVQPVYDEVTSFRNGIAIVRFQEKYGLLNTSGILVLPTRYDSVALLPTNRFFLLAEEKFGLADTDGRLIAPPKFDYLEDLNNGYLIIARDGKYGLLTTENVSTIPLIYDYISYDRYNKRFFALKNAAWKELTLEKNW